MQSLDIEVLDHAREWMRANKRVWLVTVTQTFGASPRPPGSLMAMRDDGVVIGSVSGGCIEDDLVSRRDQFSDVKPVLERYGITSEEARRFGLPCGGELEVVIESAIDLARLDELFLKISAGEVFARSVDLLTGAWQFRPATTSDTTGRTEQAFVCIHGPRWRLLIIGASEIARYLARIADRDLKIQRRGDLGEIARDFGCTDNQHPPARSMNTNKRLLGPTGCVGGCGGAKLPCPC